MRPLLFFTAILVALANTHAQEKPHKPVLHGQHWIAITGKPAGATAGARIFEKGGNAIDAACAMLAVVCTMYDDVAWGGECQALIYNPQAKKVVGINGLGWAPTGATPQFFKDRGMAYPPSDGALAAVTPGNPGALMLMLAEFGTRSLQEVLEPAMQMAAGYPIDQELVSKINNPTNKTKLLNWPDARRVFYPHPSDGAPKPGEIWRQPDLLATLQKLVDAEAQALAQGKSRHQAIEAAFNRFYKGDIAQEFVRGSQELGGLHTLEDLAEWKPRIEEPVQTSYRGVDVYKLTVWTQGPAMLQAVNILENFDLASMGYNSSRYIHHLCQAMNLAFADRDFYYGDPTVPPAEPIAGLLSKDYAKARAKTINLTANDPEAKPGDPFPFQHGKNPHLKFLEKWGEPLTNAAHVHAKERSIASADFDTVFRSGTTSIQAADKTGWVISVTPSGGWLPVPVAGKTGIGMSQRMQSFVLDERENPYNVVAPRKQPRVTLTPTLAFKNNKPFLCFSVQGGDTQDQNLLQFFLNMVEFGMTVQEACEAANITSYQMRASFGKHDSQPGRLTLNEQVPDWVRRELRKMGYKLDFARRTSGPITAIYFDHDHGTMWGGASNDGDDYGLAW
ncbi:MAG TPA: gamma-glutamyltransferase [Methylomirabilota bacterium]|nr:gamma-glutamyltransferase [Methylomirabilota bacterium]